MKCVAHTFRVSARKFTILFSILELDFCHRNKIIELIRQFFAIIDSLTNWRYLIDWSERKKENSERRNWGTLKLMCCVFDSEIVVQLI